MKKSILALTLISVFSNSVMASKVVDVKIENYAPIEQFYQGYDVEQIPKDAFQQWPYYTYASMHINKFLKFGVHTLPSVKPAKLGTSDAFKISPELRADLINTQVKGFMVMKDNKVLAEHYDNGYKADMINNIQSAAKSYVGVLLGKSVDAGLIDLKTQAKVYLPVLKGSIIGEATIGDIARMDSGIEPLSDYHTPGSNGYEWEKEIGLQPAGKPIGHLNAIMNAKATKSERGTNWDYTDQNTDTLALIIAEVQGKPFEVLLGELHAEYGGVDTIEIAKTSDGTTSPSYGINTSLVDFTLFGQYISQGKAGKSFYAELANTSDDVLRGTPFSGDAFSVAGDMTYDMQSYTINDKNIILSHGSFGQTTFSDVLTGVTVAFQSDWATNTEASKLQNQILNAVNIIEELRK